MSIHLLSKEFWIQDIPKFIFKLPESFICLFALIIWSLPYKAFHHRNLKIMTMGFSRHFNFPYNAYLEPHMTRAMDFQFSSFVPSLCTSVPLVFCLEESPDELSLVVALVPSHVRATRNHLQERHRLKLRNI